ncbi:hypothetical protein ACDP63_22360 [Paracoccus sp. P2]|uniref:Uncharacterized protein n=1 Tax=Paracoccus pantotrophus TaxID=82367 RepID=A0A7H9BQU8_PARPN|nr:hypothetical protein [Paracoccus pantotrophus]MDF3856294.1 hypothetical protein [Paracoccus pantotrophus]QLH13205.1 hypothetical protein HYQ43_02615 [Paracoccus pantotrophus]RDD96493.1 hypothetical protein DTW92_12520 [Paracoccus pantotrophus]RNI16555.1 hypothetical protein EB844_13770 [Paracoccus pantotrophus]WGR66782.1 hypothetical protein E3U24_16000 [Paracoccus pantotrophus]
MTGGAIQNRIAGPAYEFDIGVNAMAPGPVGTPLIPAGTSAEAMAAFGAACAMKRPAPPAEAAEAAEADVMPAKPRPSHVSAATIAVTDCKPTI